MQSYANYGQMKRFALLGMILMLLWGSLHGQSNAIVMGQGSETVVLSCPQTIQFYDPGGANSNYANGSDYVQTFVSSDPNMCLQVSFNSFYTESGYDYLYIFDGSQFVNKYSGNSSIGTIVASSGTLTFIFHSDNSINKPGWSATITCVSCSSSSSGNGIVTLTCPQTINFYDPGGANGNYANNSVYVQTFVSSDPDMCLQVSFNSFYTESGYDYLYIFDGSQFVNKYSGNNSIGTIVSSSGSLTFFFYSDNYSNYSGWAATISCVDCSEIPDDCDPQSTTNGSPCSQQTAAHPFCTDENPYGVTYSSGTGSSVTAGSFFGNSYGSGIGCLGSTPRPAWYYMQINQPGDLLIYIQQFNTSGSGIDVDFACWGPFTADNQADFMEQLCCGHYTFTDSDLDSHRPTGGNHSNGNTGGYPDGTMIDCSYTAQYTEWCYIPNAQAGQWYLLLITNYNGSAGTVTFSPVEASSSATTNCSLLAPIIANSPLCEGNTLVLTCQNPQTGATYNWSGPNGWTATTTEPTVSIEGVTTSHAGQYTLHITGVSVNVVDADIEVVVNQNTTSTDTREACNSYTWIDGVTYTESNYTATHTLTNAAGCDSIVTLNLTINQSITSTDTHEACNSYTWIDGNTYTESNNTATHTLTSVQGCDSVVTLNLTINQSIISTDVQEACDSFAWIDGNTYTESNNTATHTLTSVQGCDSIVTLNLTVNYSSSVIDTQEACDSYTWIDGNTYTESTDTASYVLTNVAGCDSIITLNLTIHHSSTGIDTHEACDSYTWIDGNTYTESNNTATHTLTNAAGCDSIVTLNLTINYSTNAIDTQVACDSYTWIDGNTYSESNYTATHTLTNAAGCDSIITLHLTVNHSITVTDTHEACESYTWIDGNTYTSSNNTATQTLTNMEGCDSVVNLQLTVFQVVPEIVYKDTCSFYTWHGTTYNSTGIYAYPLVDEHGCPRTDTLYLNIHTPSPASMSTSLCSSYEWNGETYSESGVYTYAHADENNCWQVDTLYLTITPPTPVSEVVTACESYEWNETLYSQSGTYLYAHTDVNNCQQVDTLHLTVYHALPLVERVIVCEPYSWHNVQHETSGVYTYNYLDQHNCPCVDTLYLTVTSEPELLLNEIINATCNQDNGQVKFDAMGGTLPYHYIYLPSGEEAQFDHLAVGSYHLQMIDSIGCTADAYFDITNIIHQVDLVSVTDAHCGHADGAAQVAASGGFGQFTYHWSSPIVSETNIAEQLMAGNYSVEVVDSNGCGLSLNFRVHDIEGPEACFYFSNTNEKTVIMVNCTPEENLIYWGWTFGDGQYSDEWQPTHTYNETGQFPVVLTVEDDNNCVDSVSMMYVIREVPTFYVPSAFIPESEIAENRVFKPIGNSISEKNYEMLIFDRWGELVFVSNNPDYGWDGHINGTLAPQGTYTYKIKYQDLVGKPKTVKGTVLLLRGTQK